MPSQTPKRDASVENASVIINVSAPHDNNSRVSVLQAKISCSMISNHLLVAVCLLLATTSASRTQATNARTGGDNSGAPLSTQDLRVEISQNTTFDKKHQPTGQANPAKSTSNSSNSPATGVKPQTPKDSKLVDAQLDLANTIKKKKVISITSTTTETPRHWSVLQNYYNKLSQLYRIAHQSMNPSEQPIYVIGEAPTYSFANEASRLAASFVAAKKETHQNETAKSRNNNSTPAAPSVAEPNGSQPSVQSPAKTVSQASEVFVIYPNDARFNHQSSGGENCATSPILDADSGDNKLQRPDETRGPEHHAHNRLNLSESLMAELVQKRVSHQQETFGNDLNCCEQYRFREMALEEAYCKPSRNHLTSDWSARTKPAAFPAHVGIYRGKPRSDNYMCAGIWVNENFVLTLATCVASADENRLLVRMAEWNLVDDGRGKQANQEVMQVMPVERVHVFPKYRSNSFDHNLALLQLAAASSSASYLSRPYGPACLMHNSRNAISASACWSPVRHVTRSEFSDVDGEGETEVRKVIEMVDTPVKLVAHDEAECFKQTHLEYFNLRHPNYICSGDVRRSEWRKRLNTTDQFGSGIYCNEASGLSLVSILHPIGDAGSPTAYGYLDLSYYKPWIRSIVDASVSHNASKCSKTTFKSL